MERSLVKIKPSNKTDIIIIDSKGETITDQKKIINAFNHFFVNIGPNVDNKIPASRINYRNYLDRITLTNLKDFCHNFWGYSIQELKNFCRKYL